MAAGEYVAFIDDDALPEAEWLSDLERGYDGDKVGGSGGRVYDYTGRRFQYGYAVADRLGNAEWDLAAPAEEFNFPLSDKFPYLQGTNASFRRRALLEIGGFDEEFEYYLDETDVCCRLLDAGYQLRQLSNGFVHHKMLPSDLRNRHRVIQNRFPVVKNKIYFSNDAGRRIGRRNRVQQPWQLRAKRVDVAADRGESSLDRAETLKGVRRRRVAKDHHVLVRVSASVSKPIRYSLTKSIFNTIEDPHCYWPTRY